MAEMPDEDEVQRRAKLATDARLAKVAREQAMVERRRQREEAIAHGTDQLLEAISLEVSRRTQTSFAVTSNSIVCFVGTEDLYVEHTLFSAEVASTQDEIDHDNWELVFNCTAASSLDADDNFEGYSDTEIEFEDAVELGVEATLDGLAVLTARGEPIADAYVILGTARPEGQLDPLPPIEAQEPERLIEAEPLPPEAPEPAPAMARPRSRSALGPAIVVLVVAALVVWAFARFGGG